MVRSVGWICSVLVPFSKTDFGSYFPLDACVAYDFGRKRALKHIFNRNYSIRMSCALMSAFHTESPNHIHLTTPLVSVVYPRVHLLVLSVCVVSWHHEVRVALRLFFPSSPHFAEMPHAFWIAN